MPCVISIYLINFANYWRDSPLVSSLGFLASLLLLRNILSKLALNLALLGLDTSLSPVMSLVSLCIGPILEARG